MKPKLFIVTGSKFKFGDISAKLNQYFDCEQRPWNEPEIQGSPEEIILHKLKRAYEIYKAPVLVDDVSVHMEALGGFPGPYMKDFWSYIPPYEMGVKFAGTRIKSICRIGICFGLNDLMFAEGEFNGTIVIPKDKDHQNRDFEFFVVLDGMDKVMIDYSTEEKNKFSHRGKAMQNLIEQLQIKNPA